MKSTTHKAIPLLFLGLIVFTAPIKTLAQSDASSSDNSSAKSYLAIFEIPATDIARASSFYEEILDIEIQRYNFPGMEMGLFPYEGQMVTGVIMKGEGYRPSADGITIYLNAGNDLQVVLDKVEENGGKVIIPKTPHADGVEFFAIFLDSEGNKMGLHSPN